MVKQATKPQVSKEERKYRKENVPDVNEAVKKNALCTTCSASVKQLILKGKVLTHPFLDTLLCEKCYDFYGDGEFSVDEDGSDKYCRWCGQGGTLYLCSTCTAGFCRKCIKRNLPKSKLKEVDDDDWRCYCCVVSPLFELRASSWAAQEYAKKLAEKKGSNDATDSDSDHESKKEKKKKTDTNDEESSSKRRHSERSKKRPREGNDSDEESTPKRRQSERTPKKPSKDDEAKPSKSKKSKDDEKKTKSSKPSLSRQEKKLYKRIAVKFTTVLNDATKVCDKVKSNVNKCRATSRDFTNIRTTDDIKSARESILSMLKSISQLCVDMTDIVTKTSEDIIAQVEKVQEVKEENGIDKKDEVKNENDFSDEDKKTEGEVKSDLDKSLESEANDVTRKIDESLDDEKSLIESDEGDSRKGVKKSNDKRKIDESLDDDKSLVDSDEGDSRKALNKSKDDETDKCTESDEGDNKIKRKNENTRDNEDENESNRSNLDSSKDDD